MLMAAEQITMIRTTKCAFHTAEETQRTYPRSQNQY